MSGLSRHTVDIPPQQQAIRDKCFHPTGTFIEFKTEEVEQSIANRFEEQVRRYPERLAVKTREHQMTYDELNNASNRLAHAILAQRGVGSEPVPLLLEHGAPLVVATLGVLKAGKISMRIHPSLPLARKAYMLEDAQAALVVTNNRTHRSAHELAQNGCQLINIDELDFGFSTENPRMSVSPDSLAQIRYTSGSTGKPKGTVRYHRNVLHATMKYTNALHVGAEDRLTFFGQDSSGRDIFRAILNGSTLHPFDLKEEGMTHLAQWLVQEEITIYHSTPTVFRRLASDLTGEEEFPRVRCVMLSGEPAYKRDVELYQEHFSPDCILVNIYGAAEVGQFRHYFVDHDTRLPGNIVPVGYPLEDTEVLLLGDDGREVGFNQIGEIAVKSRYLSAGYWRKPDLTHAAFLPDPESGDKQIYSTGDLGRMLPDGCLEHLGRKDRQVKIRGFRVEVAEIELALHSLDNVKETVAVARKDSSGDNQLVAYVVPSREPKPTASELRRFLADRLPDYMIPSVFLMLDALPLTGVGKVDYQALPAPGGSRPELETPFVAPRTPVEESLAEVWAGVLGLEEVGIHDNFLELGGDSLRAGQVISRVISAFRVELPLRSLFEEPTVADMAVAITQSQAKGAKQEDIERMLMELEVLTAEQAERPLAEEVKSSNQIGSSHERPIQTRR